MARRVHVDDLTTIEQRYLLSHYKFLLPEMNDERVRNRFISHIGTWYTYPEVPPLEPDPE